MQYVNNDMDEVFRKAAEHYPLDTSSADWNKVLAALQENEPEQVIPVKKDNPYKKLLWLLLLLPLYLICNRPVGESGSLNRHVNQNESPVVHQQKAENRDQHHSTGNETNIPVPVDQLNEKERIKDNQSGPSFNESNMVKDEIPAPGNKLKKENDKAGKITVSDNLKNAVGANKKSGNEKNLSGSESRLAKNNSLVKKHDLKNDSEIIVANESTLEEFIPEPFRSSFTPHIDLSKEDQVIIKDFQRQDIAGAVIKKEPAIKKKRFYLGIMAGVDRTTIKNQKADDMGYDYGALAGYEIGKRWSIEGSVFMDRKSYYTNGKYLTSSKVYRPANSEITDVTGVCRMYDISLGAKYNIRQTSRSSFFTAAGISSYLMKKEDYSYTYYYPMTGVVYIHEASYKNDSRNFLSIANISIGYTHQLGKIAQLRIEPYVKIPVRNVGFAELPLFSTGIRAGFVRKLF